MKNVSYKRYRENKNTQFMFDIFSENRAVYEIMRKNMVQPGRPQITYDTAHAHCMLDT
jgi:hypothetical protein